MQKLSKKIRSMQRSIMYIITYCIRLVPYQEQQYITNIRSVADNEYKRLVKKFYYVKMEEEITTKTIIKQTKGI